MNQKLQDIFNIIQQSDKLDAEQKDKLLKAVKDADKELEITSFKLDRTEKVKKTTAILLEETIEELEQKRKAVEEQNRELEIEASLEKVRASAMSIHKSEDLLSVSEILYRELRKLGFNEMRNALINIHNDANKTFLNYDYSDEIGKSATLLDYNAHPVMEKQIKQSRIADDAFSEAVFKGKDLEAMKEFRRKYGEKDDPRIKNITALYYYFYSIGNGTIGISTFTQIDENKLSLLKRFRNVFNLAYKRYSDITLAEAQAREAQIELALERVRARTMAMRKSEEVGNVTDRLFEELNKLTLKVIGCTIVVIDESKDRWETWRARTKVIVKPFEVASFKRTMQILKKNMPRWYSKFYKALGSREKYLVEEMSEKTRTRLLNSIAEQYNYTEKEKSKLLEITPDKITAHFLFFKLGYLALITEKRLPEENLAVVRRFVEVFDFAYTRFWDIKNAEAQAKEAKIETALEKVRSRSLAMHKAEELGEVATVVFEKLRELDIPVNDGVAIVSHIEGSKDQIEWMENPGYTSAIKVYLPYFDHPIISDYWKAKNKGLDFIAPKYTAEENKSFLNHIFEFTDYKHAPQEIKDYCLAAKSYSYSAAFQKNSSIFINDYSGRSLSEKEIDIVKRFSKVFEQAYIRFLDLQKAEAQAREAQIEVALERIRSRTMGMQKSEELKEVIKLVYEQFVQLKINVDHAGFVVDYTPKGDWHFWIADQQEIPSKITHPYFDSVWAHQFSEAKEKGIDFFATNLNFEEKNKFYNELLSYIPGLPETSKDFYLSCPGLAATTVLFDNVSLYIENFSGIPYSDEENKILMRFGKVFQQTYTRFLDLKKAEEQAKEAQIEASLEKVRTVAMSMNKSDDLISICEVSFKEFQKLGFINIRNALIHILNDEKGYFWDYDYSDIVGESINKIFYKSHPILEDYLKQIKSAEDAFAEIIIGEDQLDSWKEFRKKSGQSEDPRLDDATAIYYYLFSIGIGDIGISTFKPIDDSQIKILKRFRNVFDLAYRRYHDITLAEEQARESQIQLALERVRARTMAMHKSEELSETSFVLFEQLKELGEIAKQMSITIYDEKEGIVQLYSTIYGNKWEETGKLPFKKHIVLRNIHKAWKEKKKSIVIDLSGEELNDFNNFKMKYSTQYKSERELPQNRWVMHYVFFSKGAISFSTHEPRPQETINLLERFAGVFDLTYTRFLDLKKAEERAREAQIEAALERVRSRSMAMHHTSELQDVINTVHQQFKLLDIAITGGAFIAINEENKNEIMCWGAGGTADYVERVHIPFLDRPIYTGLIKCIQKGPGLFTEEFSYHEKIEFFNYLFKHPPYSESSQEHKKEILSRQGGYTRSSFVSKYTCVFIINHQGRKFSEEENNILIRFGKVFEQSYTRFLDLQKAEAQAREAQIEVALERVRARTMAMQKSDELAETAAILFQQMTELGVTPERLNICLIKEADKILEVWATDQQGIKISHHFNASLNEPTTIKRVYDAWKEKKKSIVIDLSGKELNDWIRYVREEMGMTIKDELVREHRIHSVAFFSQGMILTTTPETLTEESIKLLERFADVFNLTYRRFLDLKKAEEQARESQIEAALERVRAKAMAMHSSNDISDTMNLVFMELPKLGISSLRCGVVLLSKDSFRGIFYAAATTEESDSQIVVGEGDMSVHPVFMNQREYWTRNENFFITLSDEDLKSYYKEIFRRSSIPYNPREHDNKKEHGYYFSFSDGMFYAWSDKPYSQSNINILTRFKSIIDLTFRRYFDLKKAEAQAKEAIKQASLDRVRGEIASMRTSEDLNLITPVIWRELKILEVPFIRCGVFIVNEEKENVQVYLTTPDGKSLAALNLYFDANELTSSTVEHWRNKHVYKEHWNKEDFINWTKSMMELGQVQNPETYQGSSTPPESLYLHFVPFTQGMLYVGDVNPLTDEKLDLVKTLAEAFSIAYARYEDFKNLEEAKNKIEITLTELKSAQAQLVHSEKMASLGELTAGIAHEIKNPLNFVNNFSDLSKELINDVKVELQNNNNEEVLTLLENLEHNLDKIYQHGKRADSIIKGMLLHSRGTSGEKTLTDINDLLDQYINLAYHGMRAQNKEFNITIEKDYDESIDKINVVPQDISRVFLNIINNACYAAFDRKKKSSESNFLPILKVSTKNLKDKVEIQISDNGNGIPSDIVDKIFQPFFTTKPTGEGTGLGLSLSYDIVTKVHGGELKVETNIGDDLAQAGTTFIVALPY